MCTEPTRYTTAAPRVTFHANARVCASGCADSATAIAAATIALRLKGRLKIIKAPLDAMAECGIEIDAVAEIANEVGDGKAAGVLQHPAHGQRARGVRERRLPAGILAEGAAEHCERHR